MHGHLCQQRPDVIISSTQSQICESSGISQGLPVDTMKQLGSSTHSPLNRSFSASSSSSAYSTLFLHPAKESPQILFGQPHARQHLTSERDKEQIQSHRNNDQTITRDECRAFIAVICTLDLITIILTKANAFKNASIRRRSR